MKRSCPRAQPAAPGGRRTLAEFPHPKLNEPLAIRNTYDGREAFVVRTEPKRLLLIGATELGASHAAFRFLEALGCRWFFPAPEWEVVPQRPELTVSLDEADRPRILSRRIAYGFGTFTEPRRPKGRSSLDEYQAWMRRNRMGQSLPIATSHAWQAIIIANQQTFDEHPEYLAVCVVVSLVIYFSAHRVQSRMRSILWADAIGLALFATVGAERATSVGASPLVAVVMGVITACFGGIIRDLLGQTRSIIFSYEIYVTAALGAATVFVGFHAIGLPREMAVVGGISTGFVLRAGALLWGWSLPHPPSRPPNAG